MIKRAGECVFSNLVYETPMCEDALGHIIWYMEGFVNKEDYIPFNDYPQFALPLYNLCSNVGLYETAAITNRSNILSPKYLRLNL